MTSVKVFCNSVTIQEIAPAEFNVTIKALSNPVFEGDPRSAVDYLKSLGVGRSVETRVYDAEGKWISSRSCMNKPALWADLLTVEQI